MVQSKLTAQLRVTRLVWNRSSFGFSSTNTSDLTCPHDLQRPDLDNPPRHRPAGNTRGNHFQIWIKRVRAREKEKQMREERLGEKVNEREAGLTGEAANPEV